MKKLLKLTLLTIVLFSGCAFTFSPPTNHEYISMVQNPVGTAYFNINWYLWPLNAKGIQYHGDTSLLFLDTKANSINSAYYAPVRLGKGFEVGFNPFMTFELWRAGIFDTSLEYPVYSYLPVLGGGIKVTPFVKTKHFIIGLSITPIAAGIYLPQITNDTIIDTDSPTIDILPDMLTPVTAFTYYFFSRAKTKFYIGPYITSGMVPFAGMGLNSGISFTKKGKEFLRIGLSTGYYSDDVYRDYNLFPFAFMMSLWKTF